MAQTLLFEQKGHLPQGLQSCEDRLATWPIIAKMLKINRIQYIEYAFAEQILSTYQQNQAQASEAMAAFICHLLLAARKGHLCVKVSVGQLQPSPHILWVDNDCSKERPLSLLEQDPEEWKSLEEMIILGAKMLPNELVSILPDPSEDILPHTPFCRWKDLYYLQRNWIFETFFLKHLQRITSLPPCINFETARLQKQLLEWEESKVLTSQQIQAISLAMSQGFTVIYGGPGTGKTHTAGYLIKAFWGNLDTQQRENCEIALAAPTGKAAANLQAAFARATSDITNFKPLVATTLHSLLGLRLSSQHSDTPLPILSADLVVVDESSMIDLRLMSYLFAAVKPGARLILLGDRYQLPSIESGSLFADIVLSQPHHTAALQTCLRVELESILAFAQAINEGKSSEALDLLKAKEQNGLCRIDIEGDESNVRLQQQAILKHAIPNFPVCRQPIGEPLEVIRAFQGFCLLSPLRQGPFGIEALNQLLLEHFMKNTPPGGWLIAPILITYNDYKLKLCNGEIGVIVRKIPYTKNLGHKKGFDPLKLPLQEDDYALFLNRESEGPKVRRFSALFLPKHEYAYCLSVHKSQGSEFERVLMLVPPGSEIFGREVLYTAATRARKQLHVWGSDAIIAATISRQSHRLSGIPDRCNN